MSIRLQFQFQIIWNVVITSYWTQSIVDITKQDKMKANSEIVKKLNRVVQQQKSGVLYDSNEISFSFLNFVFKHQDVFSTIQQPEIKLWLLKKIYSTNRTPRLKEPNDPRYHSNELFPVRLEKFCYNHEIRHILLLSKIMSQPVRENKYECFLDVLTLSS